MENHNQNTASFERLNQAISDFSNSLINALTPALESVVDFFDSIHNFVELEYIKAGKPCGDSNEGMLKWFSDVCQSEKLQYQNKETLERQQILSDIKNGHYNK